MPGIYEISDAYFEQAAALDPYEATLIGTPGYDDKATDYSPEGYAARSALDRRTLAALEATAVTSQAERVAKDVLAERLRSQLSLDEAGENLRTVNVLRPPSGYIRQAFDQMAKDTEADWAAIARRLSLAPQALAGYRATLDEGLRRSLTSTARLAQAVAAQADTWAGTDGSPSFFHNLIAPYAQRAGANSTLASDLAEGANAAAAAYREFAVHLRETYAPRATAPDGAGEARYQLHCQQYSGIQPDLKETYAWGWEELARLTSEMEATAQKISSGASPAEAVAILNSDDTRAIQGVEPYRVWLQEIHDAALRELGGAHFDIDPRVNRIEVMIPPPGGALAPYYTSPTEDFTRPGRTWWPAGSATRFPRWDRVSIAYHEGVPGHHLQSAAQATTQGLSRYQRHSFISGHGEGWALYAERLMAELGYLENPDYYMGYLSSQAFRTVRIIIDIGLHLGLPIPPGESYHPGETWTYELAVEFASQRAHQTREFMTSEVLRYLGWPAQAISYKLGEREWLRTREAARAAQGAAFDLKRFHTAALTLGPMGLSMLRPEVIRALARS